MNIKVMYHSSTGNTEKLAYAIADALGTRAEIINEKTGVLSEVVDILFIGDGIYFGKASKEIINFINLLDPGFVKHAAVFATYGGQSKIGSYICTLLQEKGVNVIDEQFLCPGQAWFFVNKNRPNKDDLDKIRDFAINTKAEVKR